MKIKLLCFYCNHDWTIYFMPKSDPRCPICNDDRIKELTHRDEKGNVYGYPDDFDENNGAETTDDYDDYL